MQTFREAADDRPDREQAQPEGQGGSATSPTRSVPFPVMMRPGASHAPARNAGAESDKASRDDLGHLGRSPPCPSRRRGRPRPGRAGRGPRRRRRVLVERCRTSSRRGRSGEPVRVGDQLGRRWTSGSARSQTTRPNVRSRSRFARGPEDDPAPGREHGARRARSARSEEPLLPVAEGRLSLLGEDRARSTGPPSSPFRHRHRGRATPVVRPESGRSSTFRSRAGPRGPDLAEHDDGHS